MRLAITRYTPLHYAVEDDYLDVAKTLLAHGADARMTQMYPRYNALNLAIRANASTELIRLLLNSVKGYDRQKLLDRNVPCEAAIHIAAQQSRTFTLKALLDFGAQLESKITFNGDTALTIAVRNNRRMAAEFFADSGADINASDAEGKTALMIAIDYGYDRAAEMILGRGANVRAASRDGNTALHFAARNDALMSSQTSGAIIRTLLSEGADVNAKNSKNQTALDLAANCTDDATIALLRSYGAVLYRPNKDVRERYLDLFDPDPNASNASNAVTQGSVDSLHTTLAESTSLSIVDTAVDQGQEPESRGEKNELMLKRLALNEGGGDAFSEEPY